MAVRIADGTYKSRRFSERDRSPKDAFRTCPTRSFIRLDMIFAHQEKEEEEERERISSWSGKVFSLCAAIKHGESRLTEINLSANFDDFARGRSRTLEIRVIFYLYLYISLNRMAARTRREVKSVWNSVRINRPTCIYFVPSKAKQSREFWLSMQYVAKIRDFWNALYIREIHYQGH